MSNKGKSETRAQKKHGSKGAKHAAGGRDNDPASASFMNRARQGADHIRDEVQHAVGDASERNREFATAVKDRAAGVRGRVESGGTARSSAARGPDRPKKARKSK